MREEDKPSECVKEENIIMRIYGIIEDMEKNDESIHNSITYIEQNFCGIK